MPTKLRFFIRFATSVAAIASVAGCQSASNNPGQAAPLDAKATEFMYSTYRSSNCDVLATTLAQSQSSNTSSYAVMIRQVMAEKKCGAEQASLAQMNSGVGGLATPATPSGEVKDSKGKLGVYFNKNEMTPELAQALGMPIPRGVLVTGTGVGGAAEAAGLRSLDVILTADDSAYNNSDALRAYIGTLSVGHPLKLTFWRNRAEQNLVVVLGNVASPTSVADGAPGYCYVSAPSATPGLISWRSSIFPVSVSTPSSLQERGKEVGALFRSYLLQNVSSAHVSETAVGICNAGLGNVASIWKADVSSTQNQKYQEWGGETVDLVWKP